MFRYPALVKRNTRKWAILNQAFRHVEGSVWEMAMRECALMYGKSGG